MLRSICLHHHHWSPLKVEADQNGCHLEVIILPDKLEVIILPDKLEVIILHGKLASPITSK